jgi:hypothetical protein
LANLKLSKISKPPYSNSASESTIKSKNIIASTLEEQTVSQFAVIFSEENWRAIQSLIQEGCQRYGGLWVTWGKQIVDHIELAIIDQINVAFDESSAAEANLDMADLQPSIDTPVESVPQAGCSDGKHAKMIWVGREKRYNCMTDYYLCPRCGRVLMHADFGEDFESDVSLLKGEIRDKAMQLIRTNPIYRQHLLRSEPPYGLRSRTERGNPKRYTEEELEVLETTRWLLKLEDGEWPDDHSW